MNNLVIFKLEDIMMDNIKFTRPIKIKNDIVVPILYNTNGKSEPLLVQVPSLYLNNSYNGNNVILLPLVGRTEYTTMDIVNFFSELDRTMVANIKNILYGIKKENRHIMDFSNISYKSIINEIEGDDGEIYKNGLIKYKICGEFSSKIYDENKNFIHQDEYEDKLVRGIYLKSIIEINSLVLRDNVIHVYIKPHQLRITEEKFQNINLDAYSFIDSDDENCQNEIVLNTQTDYFEMSEQEEIKKCNDIININNVLSVEENNIENLDNIVNYNNFCNEVETDNYKDDVSESSECDQVFNLDSD